MKQTAIPHKGPYAKPVISAGSSEKSSFMNAGMMGIENSIIIRTVLSAPITAVTVNALTLNFFDFMLITLNKIKIRTENIRA